MPWQPSLSHRSTLQYCFSGMEITVLTVGGTEMPGCRWRGPMGHPASRWLQPSPLPRGCAADISLGMHQPTLPGLRGLPLAPCAPRSAVLGGIRASAWVQTLWPP